MKDAFFKRRARMQHFHPRPPYNCAYCLMPQRFTFPTTGEAHHGGLHTGIFRQKRFEVLNKSVLGIDTIEPVGNTTELWIEAVDREIEIGYPPLAHP